MFREPEYTFTENGIVGSVEVIKDRASDSPFDVRVVGGERGYCYKYRVHMYLVVCGIYVH